MGYTMPLDEKQRAQKKLAEAWIPELQKQWEDLEFKVGVAPYVFGDDIDYYLFQARNNIFWVLERLQRIVLDG